MLESIETFNENVKHQQIERLDSLTIQTNTLLIKLDSTLKTTHKENDTLFTIAEKYYQDGYKYTEIVKVNNLASADVIEVGQVLEIPKVAQAPVPEQPQATPSPTMQPQDTEWGPKITGDTYTVVEGDWLSKISDRAYGDIYAYQKIADANKITNPDVIEVGQVLTIPR